MESKDWRRETVPRMLREIVSRFAERPALFTDEEESLTFRALNDQICNLALGFHCLGIRKGDHVATLLGTRPTYIITSYALMTIGAVVVPINFNFQAEEMAFLLDQSDSQYLIMEEQIGNLNYIERMRMIAPEIDRQESSNLKLKRLPQLKRIIVRSYSGQRYPGTLDFNDLMAQACRVDFSLLERLYSDVCSEDLAFILYTSGTTAFPKGAMRTQGSCLGMAYYITAAPFRLTEKDLMLVCSPFFHIGGCIYNTLGSHLSGCPILLMKSFDPGQALQLIQKYRVTFLGGFETHFHRLLKHPRFSSTDVSSVTKVRLAAGPQWYDIVQQSGLGREIIAHHYGFTEGTGVVMLAEETDYEIRKNANGKPFPGVELKIAHPETGQRQPVGTAGEICLKGWTLFRGYYKMPQQTHEAMDEEGFFHTGDYGWLDEKGYLYYRGRYKQMVKTGGENVSQREVEIFLESHPDIQAVQVIGLPDKEWGESVTAVVQTRSARDLSLQQIKEFCKGNLAGFKVPKKVLNIKESEWPVTRVGKIDKESLRQWAMQKTGISGTRSFV